jgi:large subunit ribosomal protein L24e
LIAKDGKVHFFISTKAASLFKQRIKPVKLRWTQAWRRMNKKGKADEGGKKRTRRAQKVQKAIVGMSLDDIKKKKAEKPALRRAAEEAAKKEAKQRQDKSKKGAPAKGKAAPKNKADQKGASKQKMPKAAKDNARR